MFNGLLCLLRHLRQVGSICQLGSGAEQYWAHSMKLATSAAAGGSSESARPLHLDHVPSRIAVATGATTSEAACRDDRLLKATSVGADSLSAAPNGARHQITASKPFVAERPAAMAETRAPALRSTGAAAALPSTLSSTGPASLSQADASLMHRRQSHAAPVASAADAAPRGSEEPETAPSQGNTAAAAAAAQAATSASSPSRPSPNSAAAAAPAAAAAAAPPGGTSAADASHARSRAAAAAAVAARRTELLAERAAIVDGTHPEVARRRRALEQRLQAQLRSVDADLARAQHNCAALLARELAAAAAACDAAIETARLDAAAAVAAAAAAAAAGPGAGGGGGGKSGGGPRNLRSRGGGGDGGGGGGGGGGKRGRNAPMLYIARRLDAEELAEDLLMLNAEWEERAEATRGKKRPVPS
ncbi:hypothetical protein JKP88DRAFT_326789 [Tribonema minus]|uniref:Uncharacterized protein n=1 Tax=Tribonema minus TaxID=303371 RepID=A0A835YR20_9STRA|nr:hypothetical protein JKP88DRAFT_326789 [Tribonema minus]